MSEEARPIGTRTRAKGISALRSGFLWRLYFGYVAIIVVTTVVLGLLSTKHLSEVFVETTREMLRGKAFFVREIAKPFLESGVPDPEFDERIQRLSEDIGLRLTVIREDGVVLAESALAAEAMDNHGNRPEIQAAREHGEGTSIRFSISTRQRQMYHVVRLDSDRGVLGYARIASPMATIDRRLTRLRLQVIVGAALVALITLVFGFYFSRNLTRALRSMSSAARSIARGNYRERVEVTTSDEVGQLAGAFNSMAMDLEQRIETLLRERNKVVTILAGMVEGVVAIDTRGRVIHMNEAAGKMLDAPYRDAEGVYFWEVLSVRPVSDLLQLTLADEIERRQEVQLESAGAPRLVELHCSPLRQGSGELGGAVAILHEVTRMRQLEVMRRDFVANVSHELKTPLTAIRGLVETLLDGPEIELPLRQRFLEKMQKQVSRLSALVLDLLSLARVESQVGAGRDRRRFDIRECVLDCHRHAIAAAEKKGVDLSMRVTDESAQILGDDESVKQIVDNLLQNAIRYTEEGGQVWLRVDSGEEGVVIEVEDSGIGIGEEHIDRIFERFYRIDKARSRAMGSTGLGLSIVKHLVAGLGGTIDVRSRVGEGSTFRVVLPAFDDAA